MHAHKLNTGANMPAIGFGTWKLEGGEVKEALKAGYRLIDTAKIYGNERQVGHAVKSSGIERQEIFLTTKLWPSDFEEAQEAFDNSLSALGTDYVDLYLLHWPDGPQRRQAWETLSRIHKSGKAKAIGVSNFMVEHLEELFGYSHLIPAVNQIEFHPFIYLKQKPVIELCRQKGIIIEAYSPLAKGQGVNDETISMIAKNCGRSAAQVMLRWAIQHGTIPIPKSSHPARMEKNMQVFDFELSAGDMAALDNLS